jgi:hypothetical protein
MRPHKLLRIRCQGHDIFAASAACFEATQIEAREREAHEAQRRSTRLLPSSENARLRGRSQPPRRELALAVVAAL